MTQKNKKPLLRQRCNK